VLGFLIADDDVEPHTHGVAQPAQRLDVRHAATELDARQGGLADSRSLCHFILGKVPPPADGSELIAQPQVPACLLVFGVLTGVTGLRETLGLEGSPPAVPGHHRWWRRRGLGLPWLAGAARAAMAGTSSGSSL
jgi:hypothetical protein